MGFEPTNGSLGSYCLTTWLHPQDGRDLFYHDPASCRLPHGIFAAPKEKNFPVSLPRYGKLDNFTLAVEGQAGVMVVDKVRMKLFAS